MFIPLYDTNRLRHIRLQYVTIGLIVVNALVYLATTLGGENFTNAAVLGLGFIPSVVHDKVELSPEFVVIPESLSYLTYSFLHADIFHLGGNMLFLWVFGDNVEDALGHIRYLIFYLACAVAGAFFQGLVAWDSQVPLIGASGAIAGVVTAYLILYPRVKVWVLAFARIPLRIPAFIPLILWILFQIVMFAAGGEDRISWACHIGGIIAGFVLVLVLRSRGVPLLAGADGEPDPTPNIQQPPVPVEPAASDGTPAQPGSQWGRGAATPRD
ncbi:rhomboid family intramembrane serine protease [Mesorhizobium sp. M2A.F.Ca.ET.043.05.1.1]|uniref:rhomboid family intramembrane serine protease n=1 Tax=unclassified Mesorhizobium TaxID=325217 RepID=UPI000F760A9E|nr:MULTISPECIES: rhomboid family intramembrane serine protease [unclassified Mesorhizobium]AZO18529.1 rhomboid family intramembrane serine protease [Mesorhizobium sp. M2A.F.Ca.ET.043.05.1.1]RWC16591.1 MAG: rhomboid family intramembrane serine protease [Mesorhizobium sp.]RWD69140.1 MAG: rhomboid family intramembrane serine protease [Mesorhizobium sp.]RWE82146.1 MAG: rhomboid family intramembrane serine protease [Mesorhizobium sp.]TIT11348.1 MAG: rhomboid family intramembrane serine protease [Me